MKKMLLVLFMAACFALPALAQEASSSTPIWDHGTNVSAVTYRIVQIYRIYDQQDAYIILYEKQDASIGQVSIPKKWADGEGSTPRKLFWRDKIKTLGSYMTVYYKDGNFFKVMLTVPYNRNEAVWSVAPYGTKVDATVETLDVDF